VWTRGELLRRVGGALAWAVTAGCASAGTGDSSAADEGDPDAVWEYEGSPAEPEWTADEAAAALDAALADPFPMPQAVFQAYTAVLGQGDEGCPGPELTFEAILGCTAESGWWYAGIAGYDQSNGEGGNDAMLRDSLYADMQALSPTGQRFAVGGAVFQHLWDAPDGVRTYVGWLEGIFIYTNGSMMDPAIDALIRYDVREEADGRRVVTIDGAVGHLGHHLEFDEVVMGGDTCPDGAVGRVAIRDETDHWYAIDLGEHCDGSGEVTFNGNTSLGVAQVTELRGLGVRLAGALLEPWR
jgi:hypothetical protein